MLLHLLSNSLVMVYQYLFGPVPSRRLGVSLGIDLVPHKTCSYNCIYCECGKTTELTTERAEYYSTDAIILEIDDYLSTHPKLDFITFSGSGEPTLHSGMGRIARHIRENFPEYRIALLTNGSLLTDPAVRAEAADVHVVVPSMDAVSESVFKKIDRPCSSISAADVLSGLITFRKEFKGEIWLEIFIVPGLNDTEEELLFLRDAIAEIRPDRVQLNALDRPGIYDWITTPTKEEMEIIADSLGFPGIDIVEGLQSRSDIASFSQDVRESILGTIRRRPCTIDDLSRILGLHPNEVRKYIDPLLAEGCITEERETRGIFYRPR
ncbi:radical SAM protein [Methanogenium marinum]|uniref:Radical SAM protein n=1 Tax=Methanogenium marinum TaxID=348610 RepID=A0A9Q4KVF1_9EURY|nr:radical SAM protein [Methanogenium marinum]MDE4908265.1 radical SAM protein [Methanogenium marinum]